MGIQGLEHFCKNNPDIAEEIDIREEIEKWRVDHHGKNPTIIIDLKELLRVFFRIDEVGLILGGRFEIYSEILDYFCDEMKKNGAKLVFFDRLNEGKFNKVEEFQPIHPQYDCLIEHKPMIYNYHHQNLRPTERISYNLYSTCAKYGKIYTKYTSNAGVILSYILENCEEVMALITRNTSFLVRMVELEFMFWSLSNIDYGKLKITKFCYRKLCEITGLELHHNHLIWAIKHVDIGHTSKNKYLSFVEYAKKQQYGPNGYDTEQLTGNLTNADRTKIAENLATLEKYVDWKVEEGIVDDFIQNDETFKSVLRFCKDNIYFAYKLIIETYTIPKDLFYIDIRRSDAITFIDLIINLTMKQLGILFKDIDPEMQPARRMVLLKRDFNVETVKYEKDIIYPSMPLPSLVNLIIDEDNKSFNESRWCLLQNLLDLDEETISKINNAKKQLRIVLLTLKFLLVNEIISTHDADILLVTELDGRSKGNVYVPKNAKRPPPPMPNQHYPRYVEFPWVRIAHKYTIAFEHVCHCLEICGLRKEADIIKFDALKFHKNMHLMKNGKDNEEIKRTMVRIENIRLW